MGLAVWLVDSQHVHDEAETGRLRFKVQRNYQGIIMVRLQPFKSTFISEHNVAVLSLTLISHCPYKFSFLLLHV